MKRNTDVGLLVLRLAVGILFLMRGMAKIGNLEEIEYFLSQKGLPPFISFVVLVGEVVAPVFLIIGYRTRLAAEVVAFKFTALTAVSLGYADKVLTISEYGGWAVELLGLYFFGAMALLLTGGGRFAVSSKNKWD